MPIFEYTCTDCSEDFEKLVFGSQEVTCPKCSSKTVKKKFSVFHDKYQPSYQALTQMVSGTLDPASFIDQISGRNTHVFASSAPIPEAAAQYLREEPEVQRVVAIENDLADIQKNIRESTAIIDRLEGVVATGDRLTLYPTLSARRMRIAAMQHELVNIRNRLADDALGGNASGQRRALAAQYAALGDPERAYGDRTGASQTSYDKIDDTAQEIEGAIMSTQAMAVALRTYANTANPPLPDDKRAELQKSIDEVTKEARAIEDELADIREEVVLGKDLAGVGDADLLKARDLRRQLKRRWTWRG